MYVHPASALEFICCSLPFEYIQWYLLQASSSCSSKHNPTHKLKPSAAAIILLLLLLLLLLDPLLQCRCLPKPAKCSSSSSNSRSTRSSSPSSSSSSSRNGTSSSSNSSNSSNSSSNNSSSSNSSSSATCCLRSSRYSLGSSIFVLLQ